MEVEQTGETRAEYGERLVRTLAARLTKRYGRGFSYPSVKRMKQFYLTFPKGSAIPHHRSAEKGSTLSSLSGVRGLFPPFLSWSHYLLLVRVGDDQARAFYEIEAARESWSVRELERQIASLLFERLAKSRDTEQVLSLAKKGQQIASTEDVVKDPFVLEFLGLQERPRWLEP